MTFWYDHPLCYSIGPTQVKILSVRHGVTEVELSDGNIIRLSLHLESVAKNAENNLDINYQVITELMARPSDPILDIHETVQ